MMIDTIFFNLFAAHVIGDFYLQSDRLCKQKLDRGVRSWFLYVHVILIGLLSWIVVPEWNFRYCVFYIVLSHLIIDLGKKYSGAGFGPFVIDQILHILVLWAVTVFYVPEHALLITNMSETIQAILLFTLSFLLCGKPANIFIKLILKKYSIGISKNCEEIKNAGALIGNLERMLTVIFVVIGQYEAIGFVIAAKSLLRFKDTDTAKTEYVLAGTFLSFGIALGLGLFVKSALPV